MDTLAIIMTEANELLIEKTGHDRMPVIIERNNSQRWLEPDDEQQSPMRLRHAPSFAASWAMRLN